MSQRPLWVTGDIADRPRHVGLIPKSGPTKRTAVGEDLPHFRRRYRRAAGGLRAMQDAMQDLALAAAFNQSAVRAGMMRTVDVFAGALLTRL